MILDSESPELVKEELQEDFGSTSVPKCAQGQIKLAFYNLQLIRVATAFGELGKLLWGQLSIQQRPEAWAASFCLLLLLILSIDKTTVSTYYHYKRQN